MSRLFLILFIWLFCLAIAPELIFIATIAFGFWAALWVIFRTILRL